jgi:hypothetical protein
MIDFLGYVCKPFFVKFKVISPFKICSIVSKVFLSIVVGQIELLGFKPQYGMYLNVVEGGLYIVLIFPLFLVYNI